MNISEPDILGSDQYIWSIIRKETAVAYTEE